MKHSRGLSLLPGSLQVSKLCQCSELSSIPPSVPLKGSRKDTERLEEEIPCHHNWWLLYARKFCSAKVPGGNGPEQFLMLEEELPIKRATLGNLQGREPFPQRMVSQSRLVKLWHDLELFCSGYTYSNLLLSPPSISLSAFHWNIITKQRKQHLYSLKNTDYCAAELCSHPTIETSLHVSDFSSCTVTYVVC